jgi:ADP-ribosyl-[dinitrogen reductase] hydrolase
MNLVIDRLKGGFIGHALGDALGIPHEFRYQKAEYTGILQRAEYRYGPRFKAKTVVFLEKGQVSDDTEMTLMLLRVIAENEGYDRDNAVIKYMEWANANSHKMMGINTRKMFGSLKPPLEYKTDHKICYVRTFNNRKIDYDDSKRSNGALMRCLPMILLDDENCIKEDCFLSNPSSFAYSVNIAYIRGAKEAFIGEDKNCIIDKMLTVDHEEVCDLIKLATNKENIRDVTKMKGFCAHGLYLAVYSLLHFETYKSGIDYIILQGGDTDTNAAIAGGLLGLYYGIEVMREELDDDINILLECTTNESGLPREEKYTSKEYLHLIDKCVKVFYK